MQVNMLTTDGVLNRGSEPVAPPRSHQNQTDQANFHSAQNLRTALEGHPPMRPEVIERGRELFANVQYPPTELINGLSKLLADHLQSEL